MKRQEMKADGSSRLDSEARGASRKSREAGSMQSQEAGAGGDLAWLSGRARGKFQ
jgi:hypothetical protein